MRSTKTQISSLILFMIFTIGAITLSGCNSSSGGATTSNGGGTTGTHALTGDWAGSWTDTVFKVSGNMSFSISQDGSTLNATGKINLGSLFVGEKSGTATATIDGDKVTFTFESLGVGSGKGEINGSAVTGSGQVGAPLGFGAFTFDGTINGNTINGTFKFSNPGGGAGTATLQKQ